MLTVTEELMKKAEKLTLDLDFYMRRANRSKMERTTITHKELQQMAKEANLIHDAMSDQYTGP